MITEPSAEALALLNSFPDGTVGYQNDQQLINALIDLCKQHGYGRVAQLTNDIEKVWRYPNMIEVFRARHAKRMAMIREHWPDIQ